MRLRTDTIKFRSYKANGKIYDAFDLVRPSDGGPTHMIDRAPVNTTERTH